MKWRKNKRILAVISILLSYIILCLIIYFQIYNINKEFYSVSFTDCLEAFTSFGSLLVIILVSYFLVEEKEDTRVLKEKINDKTIFVIESLNLLDCNYFSDNFKSTSFTLLKKKIDRSLGMLKHYSKKFDYENDIEDIKVNFDIIQQMISNHIESPEEIRSILKDISLHIDAIETAIDKIFKKLY